jgi:hypothetical protein
MLMANNAINADGQKRRFALLLPAGYGQRWRGHEAHEGGGRGQAMVEGEESWG